jgi:4-amino-4-deoxy-L-arabinose transferase-like glycosyltransferase
VKKIKNLLIFLIILVIATYLRFIGLNWDQGHFLHPDERFLNMTIGELTLPKNLAEYLNPETSGLNPRNVNRDFFVYGNLPISLSKLVNFLYQKNTLAEITIIGRTLSALADLLVVPLIYLTVQLLEKIFNKRKIVIHPAIKYWSSLIYALLVLPIQQAHFFTTDTFLNLFVFASFYFSLRYFYQKKLLNLVSAGIFLGMALASKITAIFILPLNLCLINLNIFWPLKQKLKKTNFIKTIKKLFIISLLFLLSAYFSLRLTNPYIFQNSSIFDPQVSKEFINDLNELKSFSNEETGFPPAIQWFNRSIFFGLKNLIFFGFGLSASTFALLGMVLEIKKIWTSFKEKNFTKESLIFSLIIFWLASFLIFYALQFVQSIRYYLLIYPFLAILAGIGVTKFLSTRKHKLRWLVVLLITLSIWPMMFVSIYIKPHSRIQASRWIYENIPNNALLLAEHWDDALPLNLQEYQKQYNLQQLPVFAPDNQEKWDIINSYLNQANYYILSSNRGWGSMGRLPEKYPQMSQFYQDLFAGLGNYKLIAEFNSFPSLEYLGINFSINDSWAEEAFSVYDHPQVMIFQKIK